MTNLPDALPVTTEPAPDMEHTLVRTLLDGYFGPVDEDSERTTPSAQKGYREAGRAELVDVIVREIGALLVQTAVDAVPSVADYCRELRRDIAVLVSVEEVQAVLDVDEARYRTGRAILRRSQR